MAKIVTYVLSDVMKNIFTFDNNDVTINRCCGILSRNSDCKI